MQDNTTLWTILEKLQERKYSSSTHQQILKHMAISKRKGKDITEKVLYILMRTEDEEKVLKNIMEL